MVSPPTRLRHVLGDNRAKHSAQDARWWFRPWSLGWRALRATHPRGHSPWPGCMGVYCESRRVSQARQGGVDLPGAVRLGEQAKDHLQFLTQEIDARSRQAMAASITDGIWMMEELLP